MYVDHGGVYDEFFLLPVCFSCASGLCAANVTRLNIAYDRKRTPIEVYVIFCPYMLRILFYDGGGNGNGVLLAGAGAGAAAADLADVDCSRSICMIWCCVASENA